jgi:hypothetical protein
MWVDCFRRLLSRSSLGHGWTRHRRESPLTRGLAPAWFGKARLDKLDYWNVTVYGTAPENPRSQNACIVDLRLIAQSKNADDLSEANFLRPALDMSMHTYPAAIFHTNLRTES